jgi:glycosyltransferase involved in cell wall biosynthesis
MRSGFRQSNTISVITVALNAAGTIRDCVESVKNQSYQPEHIIIDGCSTDDTVSLARNHASPTAVIVSEPDKGAYAALNKGLALAAGDIIGLLHADDFYPHKDVLAKVAKCLADPDVDACYGDLVYVDREDPSRVTRYWKSCPLDPNLFHQGWMIPHPTLYIRREIYKKYGGFSTSLGSSADYELELRFFLKHGLRAKYIPEILVVMRSGGWSNATLMNRLQANRFDGKAWQINELRPRPWTVMVKPVRKLPQFFLRPGSIEEAKLRKVTHSVPRQRLKNILVLNHYAGSRIHGMVLRHFYLGREWVRRGHKVTIVGASFAHVRNQQPETTGSVTEETVDGVRFLWLKTPPYSGNNVGRVLNMSTFVVQLFLKQRRLVDGFTPNVVIASSTYPLDIFPAKRIAEKYKAKLIFDVRDLWPLTPVMVASMSSRHPFVMMLQWAEDFAYRHANKVTTVLPVAKSYMVSRGMQPEKFVYIPNGIDTGEWEDGKSTLPEGHLRTLEDLRAKGRFIVGYSGAHALAVDLDTVLDAASLLDVPTTFVLVGHGTEKERLEARGFGGNSNVVFLPSLAKASVPALLGSMDALYIGLKRNPLFKFGISPNKLFDYMMAAKPIIQAVEAGNDPVAVSGCGISIAPESAEELAGAVRRLMQMDPSERKGMGALGKQYALENHDYRVLAQTFLEQFD